MLFNSSAFLLFFPVVCLLYFFVPARMKNVWLLMASYYFYMQWNVGYTALIFFSTLSTYLTAFLIDKATDKTLRKVSLGVNIGVNIGILFIFKYYDFCVDLITQISKNFGFTYNPPEHKWFLDLYDTINYGFSDFLATFGVAYIPQEFTLLLPVGISFYTFQALGYSIDIYRKSMPHEKNFFNYALFVSFFPQLVAGPIERATNLLPQFRKIYKFNYKRVRSGLCQMLLGFVKKVVIADGVSSITGLIFTEPSEFSGFSLLIAALMFTFQIYFDFSGYSDIAIGAARVLGFNLMQNFNNPYFAVSFRDFWSRWHISLSTWFKDYLYIPLGGNRVGKVRGYLNLLLTFVISGLWHGANLTFVVWGLLHGLYQIIERLTKPLRDIFYKYTRIPPKFFVIVILKWFVVFFFVVVSYVFFISPTLENALYVITHMFEDFAVVVQDTQAMRLALISIDFYSGTSLVITITALVILLLERLSGKISLGVRINRMPFFVRWPFYYAGLLVILFYGSFSASPFLYFAF